MWTLVATCGISKHELGKSVFSWDWFDTILRGAEKSCYHDAFDGALLTQLAHDAFQLDLPLLRQLLAAEVVSGLVQQLIGLCSHILQGILLQLILCEDCSPGSNRCSAYLKMIVMVKLVGKRRVKSNIHQSFMTDCDSV